MNRLFWSVLLSLAVLTGCTAIPAPTIAPSAIPSNTLPSTLTATETAILIQTATSSAVPTLVPTVLPTGIPTTIPPTTTVIPTTTIPIPTGRIYFFWDPATFTGGVPSLGPKQNLYLALPGTGYNDWQIQTLLDRHLDWNVEAPNHPYVALSPDQTMFAFSVNRDANGDGDIKTPWGGDERGFYVYRVTDDVLWRITDADFNYDLAWFPDNKRIAFGQNGEILQIYVDDLNVHMLVGPYPSSIPELTISPRGDMLAFIVNGSPSTPYTFMLYHLFTEEGFVIAPEFFLSPYSIKWSPDGQWLLTNNTFTFGLNLIETKTGQLVWHATSPAGTPVWSTDSAQFWFVDRTDTYSFLASFQVSDFQTTPIISGEPMSSPILSADAQEVAVFFIDDGKPTIALVNTQDNEVKDVFSSPEIPVGEIVAWSPDNEWLLFVGTQTLPEQDPITGIFLIHRTGYPVYLLQETKPTEVNIPPKHFYWLP